MAAICQTRADSLIRTGVLREYRVDQHRPPDDPSNWFRTVERFGEDDEGLIIVAFSYNQAMKLHEALHVDMDLSFKMIQGKTNLFSIDGWNDLAKSRSDRCLAYTQDVAALTLGRADAD